MYAAYTALLAAGLVLALPYYLWKGRADGRYRRTFWQRMGHLPAEITASRPSIWIHAVSVGEVLAAASLIGPLRKRFPACCTSICSPASQATCSWPRYSTRGFPDAISRVTSKGSAWRIHCA